MPYIVNTDGGCRSNPGPGSWGVVIRTPRDGVVRLSGFLPATTNNEAEYHAMYEALSWLNEKGIVGQVIIRSDSQLIVRQLSGRYKVSKPELLKYWLLAVEELEGLKLSAASVQLVEVPREENSEADALCNEVMDAHGVVFVPRDQRGS